MKTTHGIASLVSLLLATPASAAFVDFTTITPSNDTNHNGTVDGDANWRGTVEGVNITVFPYPENTRLYWDSTDGLGVRGPGYEYDEIEGKERLTVAFSAPVLITNLAITDLFNESGYLENGYYKVGTATDVGTWVPFQAAVDQLPSPASNGELSLDVGAIATYVMFRAPGTIGTQGHEFSLAGIGFMRIDSVPEINGSAAASALALLIGAMVLLSDRRRRARAAS